MWHIHERLLASYVYFKIFIYSLKSLQFIPWVKNTWSVESEILNDESWNNKLESLTVYYE